MLNQVLFNSHMLPNNLPMLPNKLFNQLFSKLFNQLFNKFQFNNLLLHKLLLLNNQLKLLFPFNNLLKEKVELSMFLTRSHTLNMKNKDKLSRSHVNDL